MTQEELYWYEKRLKEKADAKAQEIRERFDRRIEAVKADPRERFWSLEWSVDMPKKWYLKELERERDFQIKLTILEIREPVLDAEEKALLERLRLGREAQEKAQEEARRKWMEKENKKEEERKRRAEEEKRRREEEAERKRKEFEEEERRREEDRKRREAAAERKRKEFEELEQQEKKKAKQEREERKERIKTALLWILGTAVVGAIIAAIL